MMMESSDLFKLIEMIEKVRAEHVRTADLLTELRVQVAKIEAKQLAGEAQGGTSVTVQAGTRIAGDVGGSVAGRDVG